MRLDFIGQEITPGCWVAGGGGGNRTAEYGMILYLVREVEPKLKVSRLTLDYSDAKKAVAKVRKLTITKGTKVVVVNPDMGLIDLFRRVEIGTASQQDHEFVGDWLHGQKENLCKLPAR